MMYHETHLFRLVVKHHQVSVAYVEARQVFTGVLGIENVLVNHKRRSSSAGRTTPVKENRGDEGRPIIRPFTCYVTQPKADSQSYLPNRPVLAENVVHFFGGNLERKIPHIENSVDLGREANLQKRVQLVHKRVRKGKNLR